MTQHNTTQASESGPARRPSTDLFEGDSDYKLVAELPGVSIDEVEITVEANTLRLETQGEQRFAREFRFPELADLDESSAALEHGVLTLTVPKVAKALPRKIAVTVG